MFWKKWRKKRTQKILFCLLYADFIKCLDYSSLFKIYQRMYEVALEKDKVFLQIDIFRKDFNEDDDEIDRARYHAKFIARKYGYTISRYP